MVTYLEKRQAMSKAIDRCIRCFKLAGLTTHEIALHFENRVGELNEMERREAKSAAQMRRTDAEERSSTEDPRR